MSAKPLAGKKIAILLESEFVPGEIAAYRERFGELGAEIQFMSRLWGQAKATFVSDVDSPGPTLEETREKLELMDVDVDFEKVVIEEYAAVIMAANYTSVRLRYFEPPKGQSIYPEMARSAPAVQFFARAMRNPRIVKGALCHGLWILTPVPELLAGRQVICHEVVLADIVNAGGQYVPPLAEGQPTTDLQPAPGVVVDGDLVTGRSWHDAKPMADAIAQQVVRLEQARAAGESSRPAPAQTPQGTGTRRIMVVLSEWGYWGEELIGPLDVFDAAGYNVDFVTPTGKRPKALSASMDENFYDPPLRRPVTTAEVARKVREIDDTSPNRGERSKRLDHPIDLRELMPERPYPSSPNYVRLLEAYNRKLDAAQERLRPYDCLLLVGGSGPMVDMAYNLRLYDLILSFYRAGKPIAAECYGVACLAFCHDMEFRENIIRGKHVTGHCLEYDYHDGTGFEGPHAPDGSYAGFGLNGQYINFGPPFYPLEIVLRNATAPSGAYHGNFGKPTSVIVDYPFITGRSTPDSYLTGQKIVEVLDHGLRRYGWEPVGGLDGPSGMDGSDGAGERAARALREG